MLLTSSYLIWIQAGVLIREKDGKTGHSRWDGPINAPGLAASRGACSAFHIQAAVIGYVAQPVAILTRTTNTMSLTFSNSRLQPLRKCGFKSSSR